MTLNALIIGCGNIGALYDIDTDEVTTYAKAFSLRPNIRFAVADIDENRARPVADRYKAPYFLKVTDELLRGQDMVAICVPTSRHLPLLQQAIGAQVPLLFCEKPVSASGAELAWLEQAHPGSTRILVNYFRRFQPAYEALRDEISRSLEPGSLRSVEIRYERGFLNNCGHAIDLLEFLSGREVTFVQPWALSSVNDAFPEDPTVTGGFLWDGIPVLLVGLPGTGYAPFEIDLFFADRHIAIRASGDRIECPATAPGQSPFSVRTGAIRDYMVPVIDQGVRCLAEGAPTNFEQALQLNRRMIDFLGEVIR